MSKLSDIRKLCFDVESTGVNVHEDRIVTAALIYTGGGAPDLAYDYLIDPGISIPVEASKIHGICDKDVKERGTGARTTLDEIAEKISENLRAGNPLIAYNLSFDFSMLHWELKRYGLPTISERVGCEPTYLIDPYVLDKFVDKYRRGKRKLQNVSEHYGVTDGDYEWHNASADAKAAVGIAEVLFSRHPYLERMGPAKLFRYQQRWRKQQCESLQAYFRDKDKAGESYNPEAIVIPDWPLIEKVKEESNGS